VTGKEIAVILIVVPILIWWLWSWRWIIFQYAIVLAFAVSGMLLGSAITPGSGLAEGVAMVPFAIFGLLVSRWATELVSRTFDRLIRRRFPDGLG
jgi:hypothetical protein